MQSWIQNDVPSLCTHTSMGTVVKSDHAVQCGCQKGRTVAGICRGLICVSTLREKHLDTGNLKWRRYPWHRCNTQAIELIIPRTWHVTMLVSMEFAESWAKGLRAQQCN